jgi:hypothetical protein
MLDDLRDQTARVSAAAWRQEPDWLAAPSWELEAAEHQAILAAAEDGGQSDGEQSDGAHAAALLGTHIASFVYRNFPGTQDIQGT